MIYEEGHFTGKGRKKVLGGFTGKVETLTKQSSGNTIVTLVRKSRGENSRKADVVFKSIEMETHGLHEVLLPGRIVAVYGIITKARKIFPVCFLKTKDGEELSCIELPENESQYQVALKQQDKSQQKGLLDWSKR